MHQIKRRLLALGTFMTWVRSWRLGWLASLIPLMFGGFLIVTGLTGRDEWGGQNALGLIALGSVVGYVGLSGKGLSSLKAFGVEVVFDKAVENGADPVALARAIQSDASVPRAVKAQVGQRWRERRTLAWSHHMSTMAAVEEAARALRAEMRVDDGSTKSADFVVERGGRHVLVEAKWSAERPDADRVQRWLTQMGSGALPVVLVTSRDVPAPRLATAGEVVDLSAAGAQQRLEAALERGLKG